VFDVERRPWDAGRPPDLGELQHAEADVVEIGGGLAVGAGEGLAFGAGDGVPIGSSTGCGPDR
jgi:hypothetical protein